MTRKHSSALSSLNPDGLKALRVAGDYVRRISACDDKPEGSNYEPEEKVRNGLALLIDGMLESCETMKFTEDSFRAIVYRIGLLENYLNEASIYGVTNLEELNSKYKSLTSKIK